MSPQFVDFDGDGDVDIVAGTYDGSPHLALATGKDKWPKPSHILDVKGQRIVMNQFWDYEGRKWTRTNRCDPEGASLAGHLTSAFAWDFDGDGDQDLLLGDYETGHVLLRVNDGTASQPKFREKNEYVKMGKEPLKADNIAAIRMADWDGDGNADLLVGTVGDSYGSGACGGIYIYINSGDKKSPNFGKRVELVPAEAKNYTKTPLRPQAGLHADLGDADGDGDLDLVVGGYSFPNENDREPFVWLYENKAK